jgi:hypothetical protein
MGIVVMGAYRVFPMTKDHVTGPSVVVECDDDDEDAIRQARRLFNGGDVEVWSGERRVARIEASEKS